MFCVLTGLHRSFADRTEKSTCSTLWRIYFHFNICSICLGEIHFLIMYFKGLTVYPTKEEKTSTNLHNKCSWRWRLTNGKRFGQMNVPFTEQSLRYSYWEMDLKLNIIFYFFSILYWLYVCIWHTIGGVWSLISQCGFWGSNSYFQSWQHEPLAAGPPYQPSMYLNASFRYVWWKNLYMCMSRQRWSDTGIYKPVLLAPCSWWRQPKWIGSWGRVMGGLGSWMPETVRKSVHKNRRG